MKRNKDSNSYIKFIAVIDIIIKNSDEKHSITVRDIQDKLYELQYDFHIVIISPLRSHVVNQV
ncbi:MAG: hypothetical protein KHZ15_01550 [Coprobacillus cateniformis]|uniref:hypothetical protein n=1 Tax=Longibaculum muris TaxID=1796628 RepID=UPI003AB757C5|nr:hypothetical protein [Coprobacillus cateniformis]